MSQTKRASAIEAVVNTGTGLLIAWVAQALICWAYNIPLSYRDNGIIVFWMTIISVVRSYVVRRVSNQVSDRNRQFTTYVEDGVRNGG